jgi:hypothetical protein
MFSIGGLRLKADRTGLMFLGDESSLKPTAAQIDGAPPLASAFWRLLRLIFELLKFRDGHHLCDV